MLIKTIADMVKDKRLEGISDIREESDRDGMRIVIECKKDANAQVVLNTLYNLIHNKYISKILIEVLLFFISWAAQKSFVFRKRERKIDE